MRGRGEHRRTDPAVRLAVGLLLFVFLLRALIPAGFMPDAKALAEGHFELVICVSSGAKVIQPGVPDSSGDDAPEKWAGADCPYHLSLSQAFATPDVAPLAIEFAACAVDGRVAAGLVLLPPALGPPLGQRAPPDFLA